MRYCFSFFLITVDFVIPQKNESLLEAYEQWRKWADEKGISYFFIDSFSFRYKRHLHVHCVKDAF